MHVVLVHPEIATNTGNVIRLCANVGASLHLVEPLGFVMEDRLLKRAGLDYHELASVTVHHSVTACLAALESDGASARYAFTTQATTRYDTVDYGHNDVLVFGAERAGLTPGDLDAFIPIDPVTLPMRPNNRSLNLANSVAIVVYEAWRQLGFAGSADPAGPVDGQGLTSETTASAPFDH